jgi:hypothetical protein
LFDPAGSASPIIIETPQFFQKKPQLLRSNLQIQRVGPGQITGDNFATGDAKMGWYDKRRCGHGRFAVSLQDAGSVFETSGDLRKVNDGSI